MAHAIPLVAPLNLERIRHGLNEWVRRLPRPLADGLEWGIRQVRLFLLGPYVRALVVATPDALLVVETTDSTVSGTLRLRGTWQPECLAACYRVTRAESDVLVVGAHLGSLLIPLAKVARHVTGIEANPRILEVLGMSLKLNAVENVDICNYAAGDREGTVSLLAHVHSGNSKIWSGATPRRVLDPPKRIEIPMRRLDDQFPGRRFDVVIMDIEGSEPRALAGMEAILAGAHALLIEINPFCLRDTPGGEAEALAALLAANFRYGIQIDPTPRWADWFETERLVDVLRTIFRLNFITDLLLLKDLDRWSAPG